MHASLASAGLDTDTGGQLLNVFHRQGAFVDARRQARTDEMDGIAHEVLTETELHAVGPSFAQLVAGAILQPDEAYCDPRRFVAAVGAEAEALGVVIRTGAEVLDLRTTDGRIESLWTTQGDVAVGEVIFALAWGRPSSALGWGCSCRSSRARAITWTSQ